MIHSTVLCPPPQQSWSHTSLVTYPPLTCLVVVVHESLVGPEQLNCLLFFRKILQLLHILWFSSIFCIFEPFPRSIFFTQRTIKGIIHNYYKSCKHLLILKKATQCIKSIWIRKNVHAILFKSPLALTALCCLLDKLPLYFCVLFLSTTNPEKHLYTQNMKLINTRILRFVLLICDQCFVFLCPLCFHVCHFPPELTLRPSAGTPLSRVHAYNI